MTDNFETDIIERQRLALEAIFEAWDKYSNAKDPREAWNAYDDLEAAIMLVRSASTMTGTSENTDANPC